ncbi:MAG: glycosyltransferase [Nitrospira sp.]|nr:glycosyltransferase [Nitrospira sp.]
MPGIQADRGEVRRSKFLLATDSFAGGSVHCLDEGGDSSYFSVYAWCRCDRIRQLASESGELTHVFADTIFTIPQWFFLSFFIFQTVCSLSLELISFHFLVRHLPRRALDDLPRTQTGFEPQISILVPAYNEEQTIADSVRSLLQLQYAEFEVVVINDGSKDRTLDVLIEEFELVPFPEAYPVNLQTEKIRAVYISKRNSKVRVTCLPILFLRYRNGFSYRSSFFRQPVLCSWN